MMQVRHFNSADSTYDSCRTSLETSKSKGGLSWAATETYAMSQDVTPPSLRRAAVTRVSNSDHSDGQSNGTPSILTGQQLVPGETMDTPKKRLLSQSCQPLSQSSSLMIKRIVENQNLLIWQAYDSWRQKFPRLKLNDEEAEKDAIDPESDSHEDDSYVRKTPAELAATVSSPIYD